METGIYKLSVSTAAELEDLEVLRFQQNPDDPDALSEKFIGEVGTDEISIRTQVFDTVPVQQP
jgi:hypothetical protein